MLSNEVAIPPFELVKARVLPETTWESAGELFLKTEGILVQLAVLFLVDEESPRSRESPVERGNIQRRLWGRNNEE